MFLMIDHYDSFVYNLVRYFKELGQDICIYKHDALSIEDIRQLGPRGIILSPGPKSPKEAVLAHAIVQNFTGVIPILGICLGHQVIAHALGGRISLGNSPMHGKVTKIDHDGKGLFRGVPQSIDVTRYHSLIVEKETLPECLKITCQTQDGVIMGLRHKEHLLESVQFHPEAALTQNGHDMIENFIQMCP
ncbi:MAG: aminodeoxychorismate/anthranilate synthase component II [Vallitaleaceae bacterium]|nr:aminodeoxychorismate/anthranilate synthase component II [Vallitaleaceae bacterium]